MRYAQGTFQRVHVIVLEPDEDLLEGLIGAAVQANIRHAIVVAGIGSLRTFTYRLPEPRPHTPMNLAYCDPVTVTGTLELVSCMGSLGVDEQGNLTPHLHATVVARDGTSYGGHVVLGCRVLVTLELVLLELKDLSLQRRYVPSLGFSVLFPEKSQDNVHDD